MTGPDGSYMYHYTSDLLSLKHATPTPAPYPDHRIANIRTPLNIHEWQACLRLHLDTDFAAYILGQVETDETENWNGKLKAETESGKLERKTES